MPRPKGYRLSRDSREQIGASQRRAWEQRRTWLDVSKNILAAANAGDRQLASDLLHDYMDSRHAEAENSVHGLQTLDESEIRAMLDSLWAEMDELQQETERLWRERDTPTFSAAEIEQIRSALLQDVRAVLAITTALRRISEGHMDLDSPYAGIPSPTQRAAARRRIDAMQQGEPMTGPLPHNAAGGGMSVPGNAATAPYVERTQTRHVPMTGRHSHDHASHGHSDHDDGIHYHEHDHSGDAGHDHSHH